MTIAEMKNYLAKLTSHVLFEYKGKSCGIDPLSRNKFDMWYGPEGTTVSSVDDVMTTKFFDGKSLEEIWDDVTELDF